jgi:hypothetical protein
MANSVIGALRVNLGLDSAQFQQGMGRAQNSMRGMVTVARAAAAALAAVAVGVGAAVRGQLRDIDDMAKAAQRIGIPVEELSRLRHAADLSAVSASSLETAMQRLARSMATSPRDFTALGIAVRDANGQMRPITDVMGDVADRLAAMPEGAQRTALAIRLLGRSGADLIPMLAGGSAGLRAMTQEADALGLTVSGRTAAQVQAFNDNLTRLGAQFTGIARLITAELAPILEALSNGIVAAAARFRGMSEAIGGFRGFVIAAALAVTAFYVPAMYAAVVATGAFISSLVTLRGVMLASGIGAFIVGAGMAINWLIQLREKTASWGEALGLLGEIAAATWEGIVRSAQAIPIALNATWDRMTAGFQRALASMAGMWQGFLQALSDGVARIPGIGAEAASMFDGAIASANNFATAQRNLASMSEWRADTGARIAAERMSSAWDRARTAVDAVRDVLSRTGDEAVDVAAAIAELNGALDETQNSGGRARDGLNKTKEGAEAVAAAMRSVESSFESAFVNFVTGTASARDAIRSLLQDLAKLAAQAAFRSLFSNMFNPKGAGIFGSIFGGFRAAGGPVSAGRAYVVGEKGPEMFVPKAGGTIIPNGANAGGAVTINIDARGAVEGVADQINAAISRRIPEIARASSAYGTDRSLRGYGV